MVFILLSPHPISGTKHTKNDCIGPLELFVTFRCYIYATLSFFLFVCFLDHLLVVKLH